MTAIEIPKLQRAAIRQGHGDSATVAVQQIEVPKPGPGQILVKIAWTGLCASDVSLLHDEWEHSGIAMMPQAHGIAGHEGAGTVVAIGDGMHDLWKLGDRAGIKWIATPGTFQEYCLADGRYSSKLPDGVKDEEAGPIMCGGVTAYSACKRSGVKPGQWIVLPGAGGGLGHFAIQYARAMAMRVIAIDSGDEKRDLCLKLGAEEFIDFKATKDVSAEIKRITAHGAHGVIVTAATKEAYALAPSFLRPNGTMVVVGMPRDASLIAGAAPISMVINRLNVVGSLVGSLNDVKEALDFTVRGLPILSKGKLEDLGAFIKRLQAGQLAGRGVLQVAP
ncbi:hypothetical protein PDIG_76450 [Penicillium digitatum PHI26]|uniref:alcohol dehydrogenase n=2 Tax=Penicillium digitatum TaxID=36651 RepID=K9G0B4_PEND2|nr:hypothetical protein PDIP_69940 [Penicillium digitatum Pd1]EKV06736.1 hypothetical protein PDIG_76450 [Penicillium digitatum PHI26]EKV08031.1 hypothetical protein PDIP_69940 [Penicillium digitatum Pd1]